MRNTSSQKLRDFWYRTCVGLAVVSALFTFSVALLLAVDHLRLREADPLNAEAIQNLRDRFKADPDDRELKEEIRQLDLLARRAWFGSVRFRQKGALLLLAGGLVLVLSLKTVTTMRVGKGRVRGALRKESILSHARWVVTATAAGVAAGALLLAVAGRPPPVMDGSRPADGTRAGDPSPESHSGPGPRPAGKGEQYWPAFRGPDGLSRALPGHWPTSWDGASGKGVVWKAEVPRRGRNSPVVYEDRVFLSGGDEEALEIYCFDAAGGGLLWQYTVPESAPGLRPSVTDDTGYAASTMAADGERVYAVFPTGDLVALDFDGDPAWQVDLGPPDNPYGHASSLMTYRGLLIVNYDHWASSSIMAFEGSTGELVWETFRDMDISWTSPIVARGPSADQVVVSGNPYVAGYDPLTGDQLWRVAVLGGEVASSPSWAGNMVLAANEHATLAAITLERDPEVVWRYDLDLPEVSSTLATGERVYMANGAGTVTCLRQEFGTVLWRHEFAEGFYSSPVLAGGNIYLLDRTGTMQIFADADSFEPVAKSSLGEPSNCTAAFSEGRIYLRGERTLYCIGEGAP